VDAAERREPSSRIDEAEADEVTGFALENPLGFNPGAITSPAVPETSAILNVAFSPGFTCWKRGSGKLQ
jgi:hypothetical protein